MGSSEYTLKGDVKISLAKVTYLPLILILTGPAEVVPILLPRCIPPDHLALCPPVHEVCLAKAAPLHALPL